MRIEMVFKNNYPELIEVWESSVRATHDFLPEEKIVEFKPLILKHYFDAVALRCIKNSDGRITGFVGVAEGNIEMLFVDAYYFGQSIGRQLTEYAIKHMAATKVDVNEQNPGAIAFMNEWGLSRLVAQSWMVRVIHSH